MQQAYKVVVLIIISIFQMRKVKDGLVQFFLHNHRLNRLKIKSREVIPDLHTLSNSALFFIQS